MGRVRMGGEWVERARGQGGEMLLETLLTVAILSVFVITALYFTTAFTVATASQQQIVRSSNEVVAASETIERIAYRTCGSYESRGVVGFRGAVWSTMW